VPLKKKFHGLTKNWITRMRHIIDANDSRIMQMAHCDVQVVQ
jgi:hypothetical protein